MPTLRPPLIKGEIYHIVLRAIEGLKLFRDDKDYFRMIHDLFEFNDEAAAISTYRQFQKKNASRSVLDVLTERRKRKLLVEILGFCLMPNHIHLLVRQLQGGGISKFMRKIGAGYGLYCNQKYERRGRLFDGRYKIVLIKDDEQLKTVFVYIHTNPVALFVPNWKERGIESRDLEKILKLIGEYRWSSYPDYLGEKNFPSLTSREFLTKTMGSQNSCREFVKGWLQFKTEVKKALKEVGLE